ncbi:MAG: shikimate dehydrogenase [Candidatus Omnitrophica bacterium]|jgi:shikimate dehydrogenase|nr:shikimate dehydrogenase [Candidatus Omnitrophota bacterium]MDD5079870.1 shikimate dehydrogenase [Candidatus Omnitrophota bacterium]
MIKESAKQIYGILGYPAKHSLSPLMHNAAFKALNIDAEYRIFEIERNALDAFFADIFKQDIKGFNITVPYKEEAIRYLDYIHPDARMIAAVNTVKVSGHKLEGFNTDGAGFIKSLHEDLGFDPKGMKIAVLGAGGASKAITFALCGLKPRKIAIYNRDLEKARHLILRLAENFKDIELKLAARTEDLDIEDADLLVNTTSVGMAPGDKLLMEPKYLRKGLLVYDLVYNPACTKLLETARQKGCRTANGLGMLLYQGMGSLQIWTGKKAPKSIMEEAIKEGKCL